MPDLPILGMIAAPIVLAAIVTEWWAIRNGHVSGRYCAKDAMTSLAMGAGNILINSSLAFFSLGVLTLVSKVQIFDFGMSASVFAASLLVHDFLYYCKHRLGHRARWFWAEHVTHHSSEHYNLTTALRQPWTGPLTGLLITGGPMVFMGFPIETVLAASMVHLIYQLWIHTEAIGKLPAPFEAVLVTPSHHRVHHATNPQYLDSNYGGTLIIWDRLFGTFVQEDEADATRYGIVKPLNSHNPVVVAYHGFAALFRDFWRDGFRPDLWAMRALNPPGWSPDGDHERSDELKAAWKAGHWRASRDDTAEAKAVAYKIAAE